MDANPHPHRDADPDADAGSDPHAEDAAHAAHAALQATGRLTEAGTVGLLLRRAHRRSAREFGRRLQPLGIDPRHAGVLLQLDRGGPVTQRDLILRLGSDKSTMVRTIDELEARGLAVRRPHPTDRRAHAIEATESGRAVLAEIHSRAETAGQSLLAGFEPDERSQLLRLLRRFVDAEERSPDDL